MVTTMEDNEEKSENGQNFSVPTLLVCSNISKLWLLNKRCSNCPHWKTVVSQHKLWTSTTFTFTWYSDTPINPYTLKNVNNIIVRKPQYQDLFSFTEETSQMTQLSIECIDVSCLGMVDTKQQQRKNTTPCLRLTAQQRQNTRHLLTTPRPPSTTPPRLQSIT
jgi:hypothetical protein